MGADDGLNLIRVVEPNDGVEVGDVEGGDVVAESYGEVSEFSVI